MQVEEITLWFKTITLIGTGTKLIRSVKLVGFSQSTADPCVYITCNFGLEIHTIVAVYVDDLISYLLKYTKKFSKPIRMCSHIVAAYSKLNMI